MNILKQHELYFNEVMQGSAGADEVVGNRGASKSVSERLRRYRHAGLSKHTNACLHGHSSAHTLPSSTSLTLIYTCEQSYTHVLSRTSLYSAS